MLGKMMREDGAWGSGGKVVTHRNGAWQGRWPAPKKFVCGRPGAHAMPATSWLERQLDDPYVARAKRG